MSPSTILIRKRCWVSEFSDIFKNLVISENSATFRLIHIFFTVEPWLQNPYFFPLIITYVISFIVGVTGNMLVIWLMLANKDNRK